jgi:hypothetical protein
MAAGACEVKAGVRRPDRTGTLGRRADGRESA